ncbi:MAG: hypothetical protein AAGA56_27670, partial [Myxococcota bacterium]
RFGRWLGRGVGLEQAIANMEGATLECLEILAEMRRAMAFWREEGTLHEDDLPLLDHLASVALDDAPVALPLSRFFRRLDPRDGVTS